MENIKLPKSQVNQLENRIQRLRNHRLLTTDETSQLNILRRTLERAQWIERGCLADDFGLYRTLVCLVEKLSGIERRISRSSKPTIVSNRKFHEQIWRVERRPQLSIWEEAA